MKNLFSILFISLGLITYAQTKDKKATEILDAVVEQTNSYDNFKVKFVYKMENKEANIDESKEGTLVVEGNKYRLNIARQIVMCDGETVWTLLLDDYEVMVNTVEESDESITPSNLLNKYNEKYKSKFMGEETRDGKTIELIELKPEEGKTYSKIEIAIDKKKKLIKNFMIFDKNGSIYAYEILEFEPNLQIKDTTFVFSQETYPDVDVVDMR